MALDAEKWIRFLRQYGPIARNANMFDEEIRREALRLGVEPISFEHPLSNDVLAAFTNRQDGQGGTVVLTGTAGDGKSFLCGQVWNALGGILKSGALTTYISVCPRSSDRRTHAACDSRPDFAP